jgi:hypothetical protein
MGAESINKFCDDTKFSFRIGECGFGRPCVGIMNMETECWIGYHDFEAAYQHKPDDAYHKDDYLCVLVHDNDYNKAIPQLESWVSGIVAAGYRIIEKVEEGSMTALLRGGRVRQKALASPL